MKVGCPGILIVLGVMLIVLRGAGVIDWPWIWVTFPIWFTLLGLLLLLVFVTVSVVLEILVEK